MPIFEVKSRIGGLSDYEDKGAPGSFKFGANLNVRKAVDSLSCNQALKEEGLHSSSSPSASPSPSSSLSFSPSNSVSASPSPTPSITPSSSFSSSPSASPSTTHSNSNSSSPSPSAGLNTVFSDLILWFVKCTDGYTYGFGNTGCIYRRDQDGLWLQMYKDPGGKIKGASEHPTDNGQIHLIWATDTKLHRKVLPGRADWNDVDEAGTIQGDTWPKQNLNSTDWHTMKVVDGDTLIANDNFIAMAAYDNSYTNEALDLIPGNTSKTIIERNGRAVIGTYRKSDPSKGVNAAFDTEYQMSQQGDDGLLYFANMVDQIPTKRFPGGGQVNPGGVCAEIEQGAFFDWEADALSWIDKQNISNISLWGVWGGDAGKNGIYSFGRLNKNAPVSMNLEYEMDVDEIGAVASVDGVVMASYREGTLFGVRSVDPNTKAQGTYQSLDFKAPVKPEISQTVWKRAEFYMTPLPAGCAVKFYYRVDKNGVFQQAKTSNLTPLTSYSVTGGKKAEFTIEAAGEIFEYEIVLVPHLNTAPEVYRERVFFN